MKTSYIILGMVVMSLTTYLIRVTPMVVFRKKITNRFVRSFLYYVPYAVLASMTFPAIFSCTGSQLSAIVGCVVAVALAWFNRGLLTVAEGAVAAVYVAQMIGF